MFNRGLKIMHAQHQEFGQNRDNIQLIQDANRG
jgi:hypothetical protein